MSSPRDPPRFLDRRPGHNYTADPTSAVYLEPEAISAVEQDHQTALVRRDETEQLHAMWLQTTIRIEGAIAPFEAFAPDRARLHSGLRAIRRSTSSVGRRSASAPDASAARNVARGPQGVARVNNIPGCRADDLFHDRRCVPG